MKWMLKLKPASAWLMLVVAVMLFAASAVTADNNISQTAAIIQNVTVNGTGNDTELVINTSRTVVYTSHKALSPNRLIIDFSQALPAKTLSDMIVSEGPVNGFIFKVFETDAGNLTRMEIHLRQDLNPVVSASGTTKPTIKVTFPGYNTAAQSNHNKIASTSNATTPPVPETPALKHQAAQAVPQPIPATVVSNSQTALTRPTVTRIMAGDGGILIRTTAPVEDVKTFRLGKPERIVVDLINTGSSVTEKLVQLNAAGVSTARIGSYADKTRIVFDALSGSLPDATINKVASGLLITFGEPVFKSQQSRTTSGSLVSSSGAASVSQPLINPAGNVANKNITPVITSPAAGQLLPTSAKATDIKQVTAVDFQTFQGISRITIKTSGNPVIEQPTKASGLISFRVNEALLPVHLQRSFEAAQFNSPVLRVTPVQVRTKTGNDVLIRVTMRNDAGFEFKQQSDLAILDITHPVTATSATAQKAAASSGQELAVNGKQYQAAAGTDNSNTNFPNRYTGRKVTLEFADAEVRKIFQLLSEVSNKNFVLGDEVGGNISLKLVNVPWDQALDIILDTKELEKREDGNIILIRGKGRFKSIIDEEVENRKAALKGEPLITEMFSVNYAELKDIVTQFNAIKTERGMITQDPRTNKVIVRDVQEAISDMRNILESLDVPEKQVMIEARIVEASTTFTQSLGVNWGIHYRDGSASVAGINAFDTSFGGLTSQAPPTSGVSGQPGASAGISFGTLSSNIKLDMRLNAAVSAGLVRIVSTPKVATLNHKSAKITQGQQIPYTSSTSDKVETKFVEAALSLEVTPHINPNGTIIMKINAKNDSASSTGDPPAINKKEAETEMMLRDGETTVIGGIFVESDSENDDGVPYLQDIPFLGNLFKSKDTKRNRMELLIFITPRILNNNIN